MLSHEQIRQFHTFGFLVFRNLFSEDELNIIKDEFEKAMDSAYNHDPFDGSRRHWLPMLSSETPFFSNLPEDRRFCDVAEQLYGDDVYCIVSDANRYVGNTAWHPDHNADTSKDCYGVKFAYYLEPVNSETGALRIIPGSHKLQLHNDLQDSINQLGLDICDVPSYICISNPGDVVAFDLRCWHASWGGKEDRRMCTIVYYSNPKTSEEEKATRNRAKSSANTPKQFNLLNIPIYHPDWIANPTGSKKREYWIERLSELGFCNPL